MLRDDAHITLVGNWGTSERSLESQCRTEFLGWMLQTAAPTLLSLSRWPDGPSPPNSTLRQDT